MRELLRDLLRMLPVLLRKEFTQIRRDPVILRMLLIMPLFQLVVLGNAATFEVTRARLWLVDQDRSAASASLVERFVASGRFTLVGRSPTTAPADAALEAGRASTILAIPAGFDGDLSRTRRGHVLLVHDAVVGAQAGVTQGYAAAIVAAWASERGATVSPGSAPPGATPAAAGAPRPRPVELSTRGWYNPTLDYHHFMVPGILVQLVTLVGTLMTALNIVREKEAGTLEQLNVTPIRPAAFIAAKLVPLWVIGLGVFMTGMLIARTAFGVPLEGNPLVLLAGAGVFLVAALAVGLWISTVSDTQQQALFVTFSLLMVYILMSGLFTPVRAMPPWAQAVAQVNPLLHFIAIVRAVMLKGAGPGDVWPQFAALVAIGGAMLTLAVRRYRKQAA